MDTESTGVLINLLNLLTADLQIEEISSIDETSNLIPILVNLIKNGELTFICEQNDSKFHNAVEFIKNTLDRSFVDHLNLDPKSADQENVQEMAHIILVLIYTLRQNQSAKFQELYERLNDSNRVHLISMLEQLNTFGRRTSLSIPTTLNSSTVTASELFCKKDGANIQIFLSSHAADSTARQQTQDEETTKYKVKAAELEAKLKQVESLNFNLNEQVGIAQNEYNDLEKKYEALKQTQTLKQETIEQLQAQLKETADEAETIRYQNSQLQRDLKSANDRVTRAAQKSAADLKGKEEENKLLYTRLDELVKQLTEKESLESKVRFMEQQMANQQGTIKELRDELEETIGRANKAEVELKKQLNRHNQHHHMSAASVDNEDMQNSNFSMSPEASEISLHDELNSTHNTIASHNGFATTTHGHGGNHVSDEEMAQLKTRLEVLQYENKQLEKKSQEDRQKLEQVQTIEGQAILEKAKEIERLKQELESNRNELHKLRQKEAAIQDKNKHLEEESTNLRQTVAKLEESLDKAAHVIEEYSIASGEHCSAAELLQLRHELERVQTENQRLLAKMDQFKHEATQEQRLITQHWYQSQRDLLQARFGLGLNASTPSSMRSSLIENMRSSTPSTHQNNNPQQPHPSPSTAADDSAARGTNSQQKSIYRRMDAAMTSPFSNRWFIGMLFAMMLLLLLWYTEFSLEIAYNHST